MLLLLCLSILIALIFVAWLIDFRLRHQLAYTTACQIPGARMYPIVGNLFEILFLNAEETFLYMRSIASGYKRSNRFWIFGILHYHAIRATDIEVLFSSTKNITKTEVYSFLHPLMGTGLLNSTGAKWFHRRRILAPAFHLNILQDFLSIFREESVKLVTDLSKEKHRKETVLQDIIPRFTLNTICESAMGVKIDSMNKPEAYLENVLKMLELLVYRCMNPCLHPLLIFKMTGLWLVLRRYLKPVHSFSWGVIARRRRAFLEQKKTTTTTTISSTKEEKKNDTNNNDENLHFGAKRKRRSALLDTLFEAEANDRQIDEIGIREEVDTFMFEGYDTTSAAIMFTLFMMAHHPTLQQRVHDEILQILADRAESALTISDYNNMQYFDRFIKETLRLYPPVPFLGRELVEPLTVAGGQVELPVGTQVHVHTFDLHRDPEQFPEPERFDPDRFLPEHKDRRHPLAYMAFSAGPRNCIGQKYAMLEMKVLIANILLNYEVTPVTRVEDIVYVADIVLRPKYPIKVRFVTRSNQCRIEERNII